MITPVLLSRVLLLATISPRVVGWLAPSSCQERRQPVALGPPRPRRRVPRITTITAAAASSSSQTTIDYQSTYGRGVEHLTADLEHGDVVVYQTGTWFVDGVAVGDGQPEAWEYCLVDTIQIVWSHNCEHGVVRGFALIIDDDDDDSDNPKHLLRVQDFDTMIDFGPEQLVARIPVEQCDEKRFRSLQSLSDELWRQQTV